MGTRRTPAPRRSRPRTARVKKPDPWQIQQHPNPEVSIIIPAMNERSTIVDVLWEANQVDPKSEIIVVVNGSTDGTDGLAQLHGAKLLRYPYALGHDVGRRVGAETARGNILLFLDADMRVPAKDLRHFVEAIRQGTDVALNDYSGPVHRLVAHPVVLAKHTLNLMLQRPDLEGASMTAVPHALSRNALYQIGMASLEIPPLAQAIAITRGMNVRRVHQVSAGKLNASRPKIQGTDPLSSLVIGDHLEAVHWLVQHLGPRGGQPDLGRQRDRVRGT
ncbi:hypothetical protein J2Z69_003180 [Paenibacillus shirakamiensis]|uniref:Glycosyltransferase 2-like domain-containing protein n=1 Tax=Paenibacillus shirakamiensis TaxID=1265935 RepID=A0ABS4JK91_9BACL|nr:glycosyltransferase [Paenibacillus shirakamiensis]MBP2002123.1 hypothetical protein [Paenibacillus shirakamiensis]